MINYKLIIYYKNIISIQFNLTLVVNLSDLVTILNY